MKIIKFAGYRAGLTYQSLPYDFRFNLKDNRLNRIFESNLVRLNSLTSKKSIIISHSFGSMNTLYQLNKMSRKLKQQIVSAWISLTPPYLGTLKAVAGITSGDKGLYDSWVLGMGAKSALNTLGTCGSSFQMIKIDHYEQFKTEDWYQWVLKRYSQIILKKAAMLLFIK